MSDLKVLKSEKKYVGSVFNLVVDQVEYASGSRTIREVAEHPGGAVAVPLTPSGDLILIKQFRYPIKKFLFELPAGKLDPQEKPEHCARRELEEETGYISDRWERLTSIYTTPGFCDELLHIFLARDVKESGKGQQLDEGEHGLSIERVPFGKAVEMVRNGGIVDSKTICGILLAEDRIKK
jgi:ADP-ribose pyrophosphatase